jgi:hypothetical protein
MAAIDPHIQMGMIMIGAIPECKWGLQYCTSQYCWMVQCTSHIAPTPNAGMSTKACKWAITTPV